MREKRTAYLKSHKKSGTTMVEVLVAFIVVMLMMGMFSKVVATAVHLFNQSKANIERTEQFNQEYFSVGAVPVKISGTELTLEVDIDKTHAGNRAEYAKIPLKSGYLQVYTSADLGLARYSIGIIEP